MLLWYYALNNLQSWKGSLLFALNKVVLPLGMCLIGVILKRLSAMWWQAMLTNELMSSRLDMTLFENMTQCIYSHRTRVYKQTFACH